jgi:hypothetical protein
VNADAVVQLGMADLPIICSLAPGELAARRDGLLPGVAMRAEQVEPVDNGYRLVFSPAPDLLKDIAAVIEAERQCCQFLQFELRIAPGLGPITLMMTGPAGTQEMLAALFLR